MDNIQQAIMSAIEAKPLDFKTHIGNELDNKIQSALQSRKIELAQSFLNQEEESVEDSEDIQIDTEENDEEL
jgi:hypothetical protein